ncbi:MAG TPA: MinD/ParA family protein [Gammaproteobacteria bacterium]|nr:MinD/ParA family protein [Gammaproteobacteria bacterium]
MLVSELGLTQVSGLQRMTSPRPVHAIAVTSGKGGVGKTNVSVNLAVALAKEGQQVLLLDADLGLANVDVLLGLQAKCNLSHVIRGERSLEEVMITGPAGLRIIPAASGDKDMSELSHAEHAGVVRAFSELSFSPDVLIIDTAAGISDSVITFTRASHEVLVVVCDEPASITDAYAVIKLLHREHGLHRFRVLANMVHSTQEGVALYKKLLKVTDRFLDVALSYSGAIPYDGQLRRAVQMQRAVVDAYPRSKAAMAFRKMAHKATSWPVPAQAGGGIEFFVERLFRNPNDEVANL